MAARAITVSIIGNASQLGQALGQAEQQTSKFAEKAGKAAKFAAVGIAGGLAATFKAGIGGLLEGEEAEAKFTQAISKAPKAIQAQSDALKENAEAIQAKTKFAYEDALAASSLLVAQDGVNNAVKAGVTTAEEMTNVSLDLATAMGVDATGGAKILAKMMAAPEKAAGALLKAGVKLTDAEKEKLKAWAKSGDSAKAQGLILDKLKAKTEGAAEAAGETTAGKVARAQAAFGEMQESLASGLIPVMEKLTDWGLKISNWMQDNPGKVKAVVMVLGGLAGAVGVVVAAMKVWKAITVLHTGVMWALNVAMTANPIGLLVGALALLVGAVILAYKKSETFREVVDKVMKAVRNTVIDVVKFVVDKFLWFAETIVGAAAKAFGWVPGLGGKLKRAHAAIKKFRDDTNATLEGLKDHSINIDVVRREFGAGDSGMINARMAEGPEGRAIGGPVRGRTPYIVGERGPELFVPGANGTIIPNHRLGGGGGGGAAGAQTINLTVQVRDEKGRLKQEIREIVRVDGAASLGLVGAAR